MSNTTSSEDELGLFFWCLIYLVLIGSVLTIIVPTIIGCWVRRKTQKEMKEFQDNFGKRDEFIKKRLPVSKWNEGDAEKECAICMEEFEAGAKVSRSVVGKTKQNNEGGCQHVYHTDCIEAWLMRHHECPTCRGTFLGYKESKLFIQYGSIPVEEIPSYRPNRSRVSFVECLKAIFTPQMIYLEESASSDQELIHNANDESNSGMNDIEASVEVTLENYAAESNGSRNISGRNAVEGSVEVPIENIQAESNDDGSGSPSEINDVEITAEVTFQTDEESNERPNEMNDVGSSSEVTLENLDTVSNDNTNDSLSPSVISM